MNVFKYNILFFIDKEREKSLLGACYKPDAKLRMRVRWAGIYKADFNVGYRVLLKQWDAKTQRCIAKTLNLQKQPATMINRHIQQHEDMIVNIFKPYELRGCVPTPDELRTAFNQVAGRVKKKLELQGKDLFHYLHEFTQEIGSVNGWSIATYNVFRSVQGHLRSYNAHLNFSDLTEEGLSLYVSHLMRKRQLQNTTIVKQIRCLKWFLRWASAKGVCLHYDYTTFKPKLKVVAKKIIFLNWDELQTLYHHKFTKAQAYLECVRDVFCFCCFTSLRYSDVSNLRRANVFDNYIILTTIKTSDTIQIELNKYSRAILKKYANQVFPNDNALPVISNQRMNRVLKDVGKICGIDRPVTIAYYKGNERIDKILPKYALIGTHTGRRTFICNALSMGIPPLVVMKWTGHSDYKTMKPYIDITDTAKIEAMNKFNIF